MDFLKSGLKSVLGAPEPEEQQTGAETVRPLTKSNNYVINRAGANENLIYFCPPNI